MTEWQPIETAPKVEDVYYLGFDEISALATGRRADGLCLIRWLDEDEDWPDEWEVQPFCEGLNVIMSETRVTHWMPLPAPPEPTP